MKTSFKLVFMKIIKKHVRTIFARHIMLTVEPKVKGTYMSNMIASGIISRV